MSARAAAGDGAAALREILDRATPLPGGEIGGPARDRLVRYVLLLSHWNRAYNLTAVREPRAMMTRHVVDCLCTLPWIAGDRLLDVGTGAGLPGLVLAIARPDLECVLIDSSAKKTRFCLQAAAEIGLRNVSVVRSRIEDHEAGSPYTTVICRALLSVASLAQIGDRLVSSCGRVVSMKGRDPRDEVAALGVRARAAEVVQVAVPGLAEQRHLVILPAGQPGPFVNSPGTGPPAPTE